MTKPIEVGDTVSIHFSGKDSLRREIGCVITHIPAATGDSWCLTRPDGTAIVVNQFELMVRTKLKKEEPPKKPGWSKKKGEPC
jgi:hypothetical protein